MEEKIDRIIEFLSQWRPLLDLEINSCLNPSTLACIPADWYFSLQKFSFSHLLKIMDLIPEIQNQELVNFLLYTQSLYPDYPSYQLELTISKIQQMKMNPKKVHEVSRMGALVLQKSSQLNLQKIVDIGAGFGYLSHLIASQGLKVIAIDTIPYYSSYTLQRSEKIRKQNRSQQEVDLTTINQWISPDFRFQDQKQPAMIIGLHTCSDLAPTSIKLFLKNPSIKAIVNVGCCPHHLTETFRPDFSELFKHRGIQRRDKRWYREQTVEEDQPGFPVSNHIKNRHSEFVLGDNARLLAISEPQIPHFKNPQKVIKQFVFRNGLQILGKRIPGRQNELIIKKRIRRISDFPAYVQKAFQIVGESNPFSQEYLREMYLNELQPLEAPGGVLWVIRSALARVVEHLVILDRAMLIQEYGHSVQIMSLFDRDISPRDLVIVSSKNY